MNIIRNIVSKNKRRYIDRKYNLDISYITPKVIAMSFPGSGLSYIYRNSIYSVASFLNERHGNNFLIINLSGFEYNTLLFKNQVISYKWIDHQAPQLHTLFDICMKMLLFLKENSNNVVVVHCNAGKGRTGTVICSFLLFCNLFSNCEDAINFYSKKRFITGNAVTQPCQIRYINYFSYLLSNRLYFPKQILLKSIILKGIPLKDQYGEIRPFYEIYANNSETLIYTNKTNFLQQRKIYYLNPQSIQITDDNFSLLIKGDITIKLYSQDLLSIKKLGMLCFNTAFFPNKKYIVFELKEIDPDVLQTKIYINKCFSITLEFDFPCSKCDNTMNYDNICNNCKIELGGYFDDYIKINSIIDQRDIIDTKTRLSCLFGDESMEIDKNNIQPDKNNSKTVNSSKLINDYENECIIM